MAQSQDPRSFSISDIPPLSPGVDQLPVGDNIWERVGRIMRNIWLGDVSSQSQFEIPTFDREWVQNVGREIIDTIGDQISQAEVTFRNDPTPENKAEILRLCRQLEVLFLSFQRDRALIQQGVHAEWALVRLQWYMERIQKIPTKKSPQ